MNSIQVFRRIFRKPSPARRFEYHAESDLPTDANELIRAGVISEWRTDHFGKAWYRSEPGALDWWRNNLGGNQ